jgi:hypothetical protein
MQENMEDEIWTKYHKLYESKVLQGAARVTHGSEKNLCR